MPAPLSNIRAAFALVQQTGHQAEMAARNLKQAEIQLMNALETQLIDVALRISYYKEIMEENRIAQAKYQHASDMLYHLMTF